MTSNEIYGHLITLSAQMARRTNMPDIERWRWPKRRPKALFADAQKAQDCADYQCAQWATDVRMIADVLRRGG